MAEVSKDYSQRDATMIEKEAQVHLEVQGETNGLSREDMEFLENFTPRQQRKALLKVDLRVAPLLALFYLCAYIDRANIGNAKIEGLVSDLKLDNVQYNSCLAIFFVPYILLEVPSNYLLAKFKRPSVYMGLLITAWGIVMTLAGVVQNFPGLFVIRFLLGVAEAGFFPGALYIISTWYLPNETQSRIAIFYTASSLSGAFSGLLAAAIAQMDGIAGLAGWRWIFILEGIASVGVAIMSFLLMPDTPELSGRWLKPDEIRYLNLRQMADPQRRKAAVAVAARSRGKDRKILKSVLLDWQLYIMALVFWGNAVSNYSLKFTMPQIIKNMGFSSTHAQLLTVPPYVVGAISSYSLSLVADKIKWRLPFIVGCLTVIVIANAILFAKAPDVGHNVAVMYFAVILACAGQYPMNPTMSTWTLNNLAGHTKRAMGIAYMTCMGNIGGIIGSYIFIDSEKPRYPTGFGCSFAFAAAGIVAALCLEWLYIRVNRRRCQTPEHELREKYTQGELDEMGDRSPLFRYVL
ncbi:uncharacterized protein Z520_02689 [Fonsecaea multimorphosa CBS 102226]|uniref:Major facilitator superfamily (MFS) profile domain-containing protein n=1 Tax=Fonsecaea multimorphosa CBS 102226 TaxID=1442371 RepID=A0A0D2IVQ0_9EURO|nr:uncharacterized protein Z520_02689 [Fonsecaea multimorphosa CBS 102226]KIY01137.1 hypothetical protein Z520_02689 [Fonsecaea multimorphosa CBS 102226]